MAKKNFTPNRQSSESHRAGTNGRVVMEKGKANADGRSAEDRALDKFAELMIEKISTLQGDWKKPWFSPQAAQLPRNLSGRQYNGMNSIILMLQQEKYGWGTSRYATFDRIMGLNYAQDKEGKRQPLMDENGEKLPMVSVKKGEKSTPVMLTTFTVVNSETKEKIKYDDYRQMSEEERAKYNVYPKLQVFNVFNLDQTNMKEARPEMYEKYASESQGLVEGSDNEMESFPAIDAMIDKDLWVCPIKLTKGDCAYYSPSRDVIVIPEKKQFLDGESFYSNLLHEMSHSTGSQSRLDRLMPGQSFGSKEYAREELVAELTAALVSSQYGMTKHVKSDSAAYLKSWLNNLQEDPSFIKSTLLDVKRSASFIGQRVDAVDMRIERDGVNADFADIRKQNKQYTSSFSSAKSEGQSPAQDSKPEQTETKLQEQEQVAARGVDPPRFRR